MRFVPTITRLVRAPIAPQITAVDGM